MSASERSQISAEQPVGLPSLTRGIAGLSLMAILFGASFPVEIGLLNHFDIGKPTYFWMMVMVQTMLFPGLVLFSFTTVVPMFWYGPLVVRFMMATAAVFPACGAFILTAIALDLDGGSDFIRGFSTVMFCSFIVIAAVAVGIQLWSCWTLTHQRLDGRRLPPTGIADLIQLTIIAAIGCAVFVSIDLQPYWLGISLFATFGLFASFAVIGVLIAYFRAAEHRVPLTLAIPATFAGALVFNGFFAAQEFGWEVLGVETLLIGTASLYGSALICGLMWICLWWLRHCGWRCVDRRQVATVMTG